MGEQKTISGRSWVDIALLSLIWGGSFLAFSVALREIGVFTTVTFRIGGGAVVLWVYVLARRLPVPRSPRIWAAFVVMGLLNNVIPFSLIAWGQLSVPSGLAAILNGSTAIFAVLIATLLFADERLNMRKGVGVLLGFGGVATTVGLAAFGDLNLSSLSQLAILGASLSYAVAGNWARLTLRGLPPQVASLGMTTCATLMMIPLALYYDGMARFDYTPATWAALIHLAVFSTAVAYLLYYRVLEASGAGNLLLVTLTIAPVAIVLGALVLGESLTVNAYGGLALLALGLLVIDGRILKNHPWA